MDLLEKLMRKGGALNRGDGSVFQTWHPVTCEFALIKAPFERVARVYADLQKAAGQTTRTQRTFGGLARHFKALAPLCHTPTSALCLPTKAQDWTAVFRNGVAGSKVETLAPTLAKELGTNALRLCLPLAGAETPPAQIELWHDGKPQPLGPAPSAATQRDSVLAQLADLGLPAPNDALLAPSARRGGHLVWAPAPRGAPTFSLADTLRGKPWRNKTPS